MKIPLLRIARYAKPVLLCVIGGLVLAGCDKFEQVEVLDANALLKRYEKDRRRHDPVYFSEVDLGKYTVTQRREPAILYIRFHLYGVVPDVHREQFLQLRKRHAERLRDTVRKAAQRCAVEELDDAKLGWLKSEMITSINHLLQAPLLRDVVFADFSFEAG